MRNSTTLVVRAVVMLACLALLPLFALFGSSTPELFAKLLGKETVQKEASSNAALDEAPKFNSESEPLLSTPESNGLDNNAVLSQGSFSSSGAVPAGYNAPMESPRSSLPAAQPFQPGVGQAGPVGGFTPSPGLPSGPSNGMTMPSASGQQPSPLGVDRFPPVGTPGVGNLTQPPQEGDTFIKIQERLRDLGAVYFRLESWGAGQQQFRFQCEMAVTSSPGLTRHFEAVNQNPLSAMRKVLVEAEAWQASR